MFAALPQRPQGLLLLCFSCARSISRISVSLMLPQCRLGHGSEEVRNWTKAQRAAADRADCVCSICFFLMSNGNALGCTPPLPCPTLS